MYGLFRDLASDPVPYCAPDSELHDVRCCSDALNPLLPGFLGPADPSRGGTVDASCAVASSSLSGLSGCTRSVTHRVAAATCAAAGARLCTADELLYSCASSTGCRMDDQLVWSSTAANPPLSRPAATVTSTAAGPVDCGLFRCGHSCRESQGAPAICGWSSFTNTCTAGGVTTQREHCRGDCDGLGNC